MFYAFTDLIKILWEAPCFFHSITGYYCPGCGGRRGLSAFLKGHFIESFRYYPLVDYVGFLLLFYGVWGLIFLLAPKEKKESLRPKASPILIWIGLILLFGNFLIKNLMLLMQ